MKRTRYSGEQIIGILTEHDAILVAQLLSPQSRYLSG